MYIIYIIKYIKRVGEWLAQRGKVVTPAYPANRGAIVYMHFCVVYGGREIECNDFSGMSCGREGRLRQK